MPGKNNKYTIELKRKLTLNTKNKIPSNNMKQKRKQIKTQQFDINVKQNCYLN